MKCPLCNKDTSEYDLIVHGICAECFNEQWLNNFKKRLIDDIDRRIQQAENTMNNYIRMNEQYKTHFYDDGIEHYENYLKLLNDIKNS